MLRAMGNGSFAEQFIFKIPVDSGNSLSQYTIVYNSLHVHIENGEKQMVRHVCKPTYFGTGHVLNSKLVSEPCKKYVFVINLIPSMIRIS